MNKITGESQSSRSALQQNAGQRLRKIAAQKLVEERKAVFQ